MHDSVYPPREDSHLLLKTIKKYVKGKTLEIGTGSGVLAVAASKKARTVLAVDVNGEAIDHCKKDHKIKNIRFKYSNLFSDVKGKFDTIIFNPPYLPDHPKIKDVALDGGGKGYELSERFLREANNYLVEKGRILFLFSSLTKKEVIDRVLEECLLKYSQSDKLVLQDGEILYVYVIEKSFLLKKLESEKVKNINFLAKGHRGFIHTGTYRGGNIAVKSKNPGSEAVGRIQNESNWLSRLNSKSIGPRLVLARKDYFFYEFVEGDFILDFIDKQKNKIIIKKVLRDVFEQMFVLDSLRVNKEEMHHPLKHVIVSESTKNPVLIDFERTHYTNKPKNVTQFIQFIVSKRMTRILSEKGIIISKEVWLRKAKEYKSCFKRGKFQEITALLK